MTLGPFNNVWTFFLYLQVPPPKLPLYPSFWPYVFQSYHCLHLNLQMLLLKYERDDLLLKCLNRKWWDGRWMRGETLLVLQVFKTLVWVALTSFLYITLETFGQYKTWMQKNWSKKNRAKQELNHCITDQTQPPPLPTLSMLCIHHSLCLLFHSRPESDRYVDIDERWSTFAAFSMICNLELGLCDLCDVRWAWRWPIIMQFLI